ncbi:MAG: hypothetical protein KAI83_06075 [Thiomargarita sp.]|nr:hypothetical protein [Thiomargarita sp.]
MEQIVIQVTDRKKAQLLYQLIGALDFVNTITKIEIDMPSASSTETDFFEFAGLWANRENIDIHSLRQKASPKR